MGMSYTWVSGTTRTRTIAGLSEDGSAMDAPQPEAVYRGDLGRLIGKIHEEKGLDLVQYRRAYVERRVAARLRTLNLHTYRQYAHYLDKHPDEYERLIDTLTINVTDFFRDSQVYDFFRTKVVPEIVTRKKMGRQRMLRVWSAGCATGEEPYSLAMAFLDALGVDGSGFMLTVFGTDLDPEALARAREGVYDIANLEHLPSYARKFVITERQTFRISPEVMRHVRFRSLNLFTDAPLSVVDVIFCRNVFIYFTREQQVRVLEIFHHSLARGGYLVLGRSEKMAPGLTEKFEPISGRDRIYRKKA
jgi:chemotaxis methyl-accepting protein methylase